MDLPTENITFDLNGKDQGDGITGEDVVVIQISNMAKF